MLYLKYRKQVTKSYGGKNMQLSSTERFMTTILSCGYGDLSLLDECYTHLTDEIMDVDDTIEHLQSNGNLSLNSLLYEVYREIRSAICDKAGDLINNPTVLEEYFEESDISFISKHVEDLQDKINEEYLVDGWTNCQDSHINGVIEEILDHDKNCEQNAIALITEFIKQLKAESED